MTMRFARFGSCCRNWSTRLFRQAAKPASENKSKWPAFPPNERLRRPLNSNSMKVMADIDPKLVKQLREKTNAGMMDCKRALAEAEGDLAKAETILRTKGIASASKKASRATKDLLKGKIAELGENIVIRRFTRYLVGEPLPAEA